MFYTMDQIKCRPSYAMRYIMITMQHLKEVQAAHFFTNSIWSTNNLFKNLEDSVIEIEPPTLAL